MALLSGERDLLKQPLLKRFGAEVGWTEKKFNARPARVLRTVSELIAIILSEVWVVPIAFEHGCHFADDIWIAGTRYTHVPFKSANLR